MTMSDIPTAIINDGDVSVGNDVISSVPDKYLSSTTKKKKRKAEGIEKELLYNTRQQKKDSWNLHLRRM